MLIIVLKCIIVYKNIKCNLVIILQINGKQFIKIKVQNLIKQEYEFFQRKGLGLVQIIKFKFLGQEFYENIYVLRGYFKFVIFSIVQYYLKE